MERPRANRFPSEHRLLDARSFSRVFDQAARSRDRLFTVLYRSNDDGVPRLGLAISRKHCRKAVERNRIKRVVRESFRHHGELLAGLDVVVMNQAATAAAANPVLFESLAGHWHRCALGKAGRKPRGKQEKQEKQ